MMEILFLRLNNVITYQTKKMTDRLAVGDVALK